MCDYYVSYRQLPDSVRVIPITEHEKLHDGYDIVLNIHSFAECSLEALRAHCLQHLGRFKTPKEFRLVDDLPKGPSGKVQRLKLLERFADISGA